jgi:hypothetical protein
MRAALFDGTTTLELGDVEVADPAPVAGRRKVAQHLTGGVRTVIDLQA